MARQVRVSDRAARDLARIWQWYCTVGSRERACRSLKTLSLAISNLPFTPLGSPLSADIAARERIVERHTIVYDVEDVAGFGPRAGHVNVLCILGPAMDDEANPG